MLSNYELWPTASFSGLKISVRPVQWFEFDMPGVDGPVSGKKAFVKAGTDSLPLFSERVKHYYHNNILNACNFNKFLLYYRVFMHCHSRL